MRITPAQDLMRAVTLLRECFDIMSINDHRQPVLSQVRGFLRSYRRRVKIKSISTLTDTKICSTPTTEVSTMARKTTAAKNPLTAGDRLITTPAALESTYVIMRTTRTGKRSYWTGAGSRISQLWANQLFDSDVKHYDVDGGSELLTASIKADAKRGKEDTVVLARIDLFVDQPIS